jgi:hypothetical protein
MPQTHLTLREILAAGEFIVDLLPIARAHYYHPGMLGSWKLKSVMPTIPGGPDYGTLEDVQDGGSAQEAYFEAVAKETSSERREVLKAALLRYCKQDTEALLILSRFFQKGDAA